MPGFFSCSSLLGFLKYNELHCSGASHTLEILRDWNFSGRHAGLFDWFVTGFTDMGRGTRRRGRDAAYVCWCREAQHGLGCEVHTPDIYL
jgi:hypothetical protein